MSATSTPRSSPRRCRSRRCWPRSPRPSSCPAGPPRSTPRAPRPCRTACSRPGCRRSASATASRPWPRRWAARWPARASPSTAAPPSTCSREGVIFAGLPAAQKVWMSHGDSVAAAPEGFTVTASTDETPVAAFEHPGRGLYGVQFHPEVLHSEHGQAVLKHFLDAAGCRPTWTMLNIVEEAVEAVRAAGRRGPRDLRAVRRRRLRGGRRHRPAGHRRPADLCLRRPRPAAQGRGRAGRARLRRRHRRQAPRRRRRRPLPQGARRRQRPRGEAQDHRPRVHPRLRGRAARHHGRRPVDFLVQGTLYPDVVESGGGTGTANIKSHHNVGGLPDDLQFKLVEPLRTLFKDEVRRAGEELGLPAAMVWRQPFPGPGLGIRIVGEVTARAARPAARGRRDRPRGAVPGRARPGDLAVPGRAAGRRPLGGRPGRRPHLRPPGGPAPGHLRGRDDGRLGARALRRARRASPPASPTRSATSTGSWST